VKTAGEKDLRGEGLWKGAALAAGFADG
jgi:hypothetical protein